MTMADRSTLTLTGAAARSHCCAVVCDYRPEAIQHYLDMVLAHERNGTDPVEPLRRRSRDTTTSSTCTGDGDERLWDIQMAVKAVRAAGKEVTAVSVAQRLCPWSLEG